MVSPGCVPGGISTSAVAVERRHRDRVAERELRKADRDLGVQIGAVALEALVGLHAQDDVEVPGRPPPSAPPRPARPGAGSSRPRRPPGSLTCSVSSCWSRPLPVAVAAGLADDPPLAAADRAGGRDHQEALRVHHLAAAAAVLAGLGRRARRRAACRRRCRRRARRRTLISLVAPGERLRQRHRQARPRCRRRARAPRPARRPCGRRRCRRRCPRTPRRCRRRRGTRRRSRRSGRRGRSGRSARASPDRTAPGTPPTPP